MLKPVLQTVLLAGLSNVIAQFLTARQINAAAGSAQPHSLDMAPMLKFMIYALLTAPLNILWQERLERDFPAFVTTTVKENERQTARSHRNTVLKVILDQTTGALVNTVLFLSFMKAVAGVPWDRLATEVKSDLWPLMKAGWTVWPLVSLISFTVIPPKQRVVFGALIGIGWNIFLSLRVS